MKYQIMKINLAAIFFFNPLIQKAVGNHAIRTYIQNTAAFFTNKMRVWSCIAVQTFLPIYYTNADDSALFFKTVDIAVYCTQT